MANPWDMTSREEDRMIGQFAPMEERIYKQIGDLDRRSIKNKFKTKGVGEAMMHLRQYGTQVDLGPFEKNFIAPQATRRIKGNTSTNKIAQRSASNGSGSSNNNSNTNTDNQDSNTNTDNQNSGLINDAVQKQLDQMQQSISAMGSRTSTAEQLNNMLKSDSPLMQRAATQGQQAANQRGLLNSSMAAEAAQGAMIDRATPIAQQDAQFGQNMAINEQQYGFQRRLNDQQYGFQRGLNEQQYQNQRGLNEQGFEFDMGRMQQEYGFNSQLSTQEAQQSLERLQATSTANGWGVMANNMTDIIGQYSSQLERIQMNPDIEEADKSAMIEQVLEMRDADIDFQRSMYDQLPDYLANTGVFPELSSQSMNDVSGLYQQLLGRDIDDSGRSYYQQRLNAGEMTLADIEDDIRNSDEFRNA